MDIPANNVSVIEDENGLRTQRLFAAFITDFRDAKDETIYADAAAELVNPERNTLFVQFPDIHSHSASLASSLELNFCKYDLARKNCRIMFAIFPKPTQIDLSTRKR
uniref:MCM N-terminal domain-containing protein n=1 Tax=Acrobeloides nanus TaxID=290746 RepID=A0A914EFK0_9BILA